MKLRQRHKRPDSAEPCGVHRTTNRGATRDVLRAALLFVVLAAASACGPSAGAPTPPPDSLPDLGAEKIRETLVDAQVDEVPEETGASKPIRWHFLHDEPTEVAVVDTQMEAKKATVLADVTTRTTPRSRSPKVLSGRLRLHYELTWMVYMRKWRLVRVENLSMTYREEPKPEVEPGESP